MREDLRARLRAFAHSRSLPETGVTRVTGVTALTGGMRHPVSPLSVTRHLGKKDQRKQCVTRVTPVTPENAIEEGNGPSCHPSVRGDVTPHPRVTQVPSVISATETSQWWDCVDWLAWFEERAAVLEFDGGLNRSEAELQAYAETVAAIGPQPGSVH